MTIKDMLRETLGEEYERAVRELDLRGMLILWWYNPNQRVVIMKNIDRNRAQD